MALLSDRFDILVDAHFNDKTMELAIWRCIRIDKYEGPKANDIGPKAKLSVRIDCKWVAFPFPDRSLPNRIRFKHLLIDYIDHSVLTFIRSNKQIWDRNGTKLELYMSLFASNKHKQNNWDVFAHEIWPIFATNLRHLSFTNGGVLDNLRRFISPTILTDSIQLNSIDTGGLLLPDGIADDGPNATVGQALTKWLHTPTTNGQPKLFYRTNFVGSLNLEWVNYFKETFRRATTSVSYTIQLYFHVDTMPTEPFELVNGRTNEKLTLKLKIEAFINDEIIYNWLLQRYPIGETATAPVKWENRENSAANLNNIRFDLWGGNRCIGPLSPPAEEEKEKDEADKSNKNIV